MRPPFCPGPGCMAHGCRARRSMHEWILRGMHYDFRKMSQDSSTYYVTGFIQPLSNVT